MITENKMLARFLRYVKINTRSDETSTTVPTTQSQVAFTAMLADEMREIGLENVHYLESNGYVIGTIPATTAKPVRKMGLIQLILMRMGLIHKSSKIMMVTQSNLGQAVMHWMLKISRI